MTLLSDLLGIQINEVVEPVDPTLALEQQLEILEQRLAASKRGLGFANKLKNPAQKKKHMSLVLSNLNKIRGSLSKVIAQMAQQDDQFANAEQGYEAGKGYSVHNPGVGFAEGVGKSLNENIEDNHSELVDRFAELVQAKSSNPQTRSLMNQFDFYNKEFAKGYNSENDDVLMNGLEGMQQALEDLEAL